MLFFLFLLHLELLQLIIGVNFFRGFIRYILIFPHGINFDPNHDIVLVVDDELEV